MYVHIAPVGGSCEVYGDVLALIRSRGSGLIIGGLGAVEHIAAALSAVVLGIIAAVTLIRDICPVSVAVAARAEVYSILSVLGDLLIILRAVGIPAFSGDLSIAL